MSKQWLGVGGLLLIASVTALLMAGDLPSIFKCAVAFVACRVSFSVGEMSGAYRVGQLLEERLSSNWRNAK